MIHGGRGTKDAGVESLLPLPPTHIGLTETLGVLKRPGPDPTVKEPASKDVSVPGQQILQYAGKASGGSMAQGAERLSRSLLLGHKEGAHISQNKSDFIQAIWCLVYCKLISKNRAHSWHQGPVLKLHMPH